MHYPWNAFSSNGKDTMSPKRALNGKVPYVELSKDDALQVSRMYNCPGKFLRSEYETSLSNTHLLDIRESRSEYENMKIKSKISQIKERKTNLQCNNSTQKFRFSCHENQPN